MFGIKSKKIEETPSLKTKSIFAQESFYGRGISSLAAEIMENWRDAKIYNPADYLKNDKSFIGLDHATGEPLYIDSGDLVHTLITAPTRAGKGIYFGIKAVESLRAKKGLIVIDPKEDDFLPQICKEELENQNRKDDFIPDYAIGKFQSKQIYYKI